MNILFISHEAGRTGAPLILLQLIKFLKNTYSINCTIILMRGGVLSDEFAKLGEIHEFEPFQSNSNLFYSFIRKFFDKEKFFLKRFKNKKYDLVYGMSVVTMPFLKSLKEMFNSPCILHVQELSFNINLYYGGDFSKSHQYIDHYIGCSPLVFDLLKVRYNLKNTTLVHNFIFDGLQVTKSAEELKRELNIDPDTIIVGASGTLGWRKGSDLFVQLALKFCKTDKIKFIWLGGHQESTEWKKMLHDIESTDLIDKILLIENQPDPINYFNIFDVFTLLSREEPWGLVCLENAMMGNPVVCFDRNVGMEASIKKQAHYLDIDHFANLISGYLKNPDTIKEDGDILKRINRNYSIENSGEKIFDIITNLTVKFPI